MKLFIIALLALTIATTAEATMETDSTPVILADITPSSETCLNVDCVCRTIESADHNPGALEEDVVRRLNEHCPTPHPDQDQYCYTLPELGTILYQTGEQTHYVDYRDLCQFQG